MSHRRRRSHASRSNGQAVAAPATDSASASASAPDASDAPASVAAAPGRVVTERSGQRPAHPPAARLRRMLVNIADPEQVRVAILGENGLEDVFIERAAALDGFAHGNIYKARVQNVEPALQAAFVDLGGPKNGFLHAGDVVTPHGGFADILPAPPRPFPPVNGFLRIEQMLQRGQELLVQVTRETLGHKGPSVTTRLSLPGRYLVLMPADTRRGISKKITDERERLSLKRALDQLAPERDLGYIIRTAGMGRGKDELQGDLDGLTRLWDAIKERARVAPAPSLLYRETDLVLRAIRDYVYDDVEEIVVDAPDAYERAHEFLSAVMPEFADRLRLHPGPDDLFLHYGVEDAIEQTFEHTVRLASGGHLVIEQTEALVAVDVNSGRFRKGDSTRETILAINKEAAVEIARHLRLRDLGGLVMIDFIDMDDLRDRREVEEVFRLALRRDRARTTVLPISALGVMELTRQRLRQSLKKTLYRPCPACNGSGVVKGGESLGLDFMRRLRQHFDERSGTLKAAMHPGTAIEIGNLKRAAIARLESEKGGAVRIEADPALRLDEMRFAWEESQNAPAPARAAPARLPARPNKPSPPPPSRTPTATAPAPMPGASATAAAEGEVDAGRAQALVPTEQITAPSAPAAAAPAAGLAAGLPDSSRLYEKPRHESDTAPLSTAGLDKERDGSALAETEPTAPAEDGACIPVFLPGPPAAANAAGVGDGSSPTEGHRTTLRPDKDETDSFAERIAAAVASDDDQDGDDDARRLFGHPPTGVPIATTALVPAPAPSASSFAPSAPSAGATELSPTEASPLPRPDAGGSVPAPAAAVTAFDAAAGPNSTGPAGPAAAKRSSGRRRGGRGRRSGARAAQAQAQAQAQGGQEQGKAQSAPNANASAVPSGAPTAASAASTTPAASTVSKAPAASTASPRETATDMAKAKPAIAPPVKAATKAPVKPAASGRKSPASGGSGTDGSGESAAANAGAAQAADTGPAEAKAKTPRPGATRARRAAAPAASAASATDAAGARARAKAKSDAGASSAKPSGEAKTGATRKAAAAPKDKTAAADKTQKPGARAVRKPAAGRKHAAEPKQDG